MSENDIENVKDFQLMLAIARGILAHEIGVLQGARELFYLGSNLGLGESVPFFPTLRLAESDANDFPLEDDFRSLCSANFLKEKDLEIKVVEDAWRPEIEEACEMILKQYGTVI